MNLIDAAKHIQASLPAMGGQQFNDAKRDLLSLQEAAQVLVRRGFEDVLQNDIVAIKTMTAEIEDHRDAWTARLTKDIETRYPGLSLDWTEGTESTLHSIGLEMKYIESAEQVNVSIDGATHTVGNGNVAVDGETLIAESPSGETILELPLKEVAAFGFVDTDGSALGWTGFNILTLDDRLITLR